MKLVFTNGCYDMLHQGHLRLLKRAKQAGDWLIVAVNDDASVRALKGDGRPVQGLRIRMEGVARLMCVDSVIPFDGNVEALVATIQPDVIVKGSDYDPWQMAGADQVRARGGKVLIVERLPGFSTTQQIPERVQYRRLT